MDRIAHAEPADQFGLVRQRGGELRQQDVGLLLGDRRLEHDEPSRPAERTARMRVVRGGEAHHRYRQQAHAQVLSLADDEQVGAALPAEDGRRRILDGDGVAKPRQRGCLRLACHRAGAEEFGQQGIARRIGRLVPVKDHARECGDVGPPVGQPPQGAQIPLPALVVQEHDLERIVAGNHAVGVVVDRFAGAGEQAGSRVVFAEDQAGVGLVALQRDADGHLSHRGAGQAVGAAECLGAEQHVHAEGTALANEAVENQGRILGDLVVLDEDLLKLVDDQQDAGHGVGIARLSEAIDVLHGAFAEQIAPPLELAVKLFEHRKPELPLALDGDHAGVGQPVVVVELELDALLEVDQVELDLVGAVVQCEARDQGVHERRFAGARLAGDQRMLARALAELDVLQLLGTRWSQRCEHLAGGASRPPVLLLGRHAVEGNLHPLGRLGRLADPLDDLREHLVRWRLLDGQRPRGELRVAAPGVDAVLEREHGGMLFEIRDAEVRRHGLGRIDRDDRVHAAPRAGGGDARQPAGARLGEVGREVRDHDEAVWLRHLGVSVVITDRFIFIAQVFLDHQLDLLRDVHEALFDLLRFRPDSAGDEQFVIVGQMHEAGELFAETEGIDDREPALSGRNAAGDPQHERLHHVGSGFLLVPGRPDDQRRGSRERHDRGLRP